MLLIKYFSNIMQGKRKLCECHTRFFYFVKHDLTFGFKLLSLLIHISTLISFFLFDIHIFQKNVSLLNAHLIILHNDKKIPLRVILIVPFTKQFISLEITEKWCNN